ncbi:chemotaxis protein CheX [Geobacter sp. SVR]|uniref:chemotaxis protein CheX n=1 Tax=Geobacter sp. SVR TaxID=2495594 RepID=UPI00143F020C|nr:chemotaxis protein CheX [Geobacter sp. SVR]BCS54878.1 chemotaxis protein CheX [Geobacter sp. SVR]GCF87396.1 chemotaxis protein CheX [Geobacter sp. SVR]
MAVKFFGQFLVEKGIVTREALLRAIELQESKNLKFGEMAVEMGYVTRDDIERAHAAQFSKDAKLGDILVEQGILTPDQLNEIVTRQKNTHLYIGEALVLIGAITEGQLQQHLEAFKADQAQYVSDRIELPAGLANSAIWEMTADLTFKMITRVLALAHRPGKCEVVKEVSSNFMMAAMDFSGDVAARYLISVSEGLQKTIARAILREETVENEPAEVLEDTVMEFVNVVCGNVAAKASQMGTIMNISPPVTIHPPAAGLPVPGGHTALSFPIYVGEGEKMELILLIKN